MTQTSKPNLFKYATSELSQDAMFCWMLEWANDKYKHNYAALHGVGVAFVQMLCDGKLNGIPLTDVQVRKQENDIDILCEINSNQILIIEDKVGTKEHSKQLEKYDKHIKLKYPNHQHILVYLQTGDQGNYSKAHKLGYRVVKRKDLLELFETESGRIARDTSDILSDYYDRLSDVEIRVQSFNSKSIKEWKTSAWYGFFMELQNSPELQKSLGDANWRYVSNPSGGFAGYWWKSDYPVYLQLENNKLCVKLKNSDGVENGSMGKEWIKHFHNHFDELNMSKPKNMRIGKTMTIATYKGDYRRTNGEILDMSATIQELLEVGQRFEAVRRKIYSDLN